MDFGFNKGGSSASSTAQNGNTDTSQTTDLNGGGIVDNNGQAVTDLGTDTTDTKPATPPANTATDQNAGGTNDDANKGDNVDTTIPHDYAEGTTLELDGETLTVNKDGNVVNDKGEVVKEAKDVKAWLSELNAVDSNTDFSIDNIQNAIGVEIVDDNDKPVQYENTVEGITSYINDVLETRKEEYSAMGINTLYQKFPILPDLLNYYIANGNSMEGYNEVPDRSEIVIDEANVSQQEAIVREAFKENNMRGDVDTYIQYLKSNNILLSTAQAELQGLQAKDKEYKDYLEKQAEEAETKRIQELNNYWNGVKQVVDSKVIAGYQIPDTIIINRNGQKVSATPNDFYNYIYQVDENGKSAYENELANTSKEDRRNDELLRAYLKFVGGDYSSLVGMAVNKEKVEKLKFKSKQPRSSSTIKITTPSAPKTGKDVDLGYN